jgi:hypothetical protein
MGLNRTSALQLTYLPLLFAISAAKAQVTPTLRLGAANSILEERFLGVGRVRELADGRLLLVQPGNEPKLIVADFATGAVELIGRTGRGPGEYERASGLFALGGDSTLMIGGFTRWLLLVGSRIVLTTPPTDRAVLASAIPRGADRFGLVLTSLRGSSASDDSARMALMRRSDGRVVSELMLSVRGEPGYPPPSKRDGNRHINYIGPWFTSEQAYLFTDGWLAVVRVQPYRIEWRAPGGTWTRGAPLPVPIIPVDGREKRGYMERLARNSDTPRLSPDTYPLWPKQVPPYAYLGTLLGTPDGKLLVPRTPTVDRPETWYDRIDRAGHLDGQLALKANERIVGFGAKSVYVAVEDEEGFFRIRRHPWS